MTPDELNTLKKFASQLLAMGGGYKYDTHKQTFYCAICEREMDNAMEGKHADDCPVPQVEDMVLEYVN